MKNTTRSSFAMNWGKRRDARSEEHTSELQSQSNLVCRLLLEKKKNTNRTPPLPDRSAHNTLISAHNLPCTISKNLRNQRPQVAPSRRPAVIPLLVAQTPTDANQYVIFEITL